MAAETIYPISQNINSFSYEPATQELTVEFQDLQVYRYLSVPQMVFDDLRKLVAQGGSVGSYFYRNIRSVYANILD